MNYINIENLKIYAYHGVFPEENRQGQDFFISARLYLDTTVAAGTDDLNHSVNYGDVCHFLTDKMQQHTFHLIEAAADHLACSLLLKYPLLQKVELKLRKPHAPIGLPFEDISINVTRSWHDVCLSIGSNMGNKKAYLDLAVLQLQSLTGCKVDKVASYITTAPYGYTEQDDFLNSAILLKTFLTPRELLNALHGIEQEAGRERTIHWGPRTLDLDILLYDNLITDEPDLVIPHPDMENRDFVLIPLKEIAPYKIHPLLHKRIKDL